jgi:prepilin-type N-terminal cleavage/methylation domain-containing protein
MTELRRQEDDTPPLPAHATMRGFTLIEMMVAMAIGLVLILGAVNIYGQGRNSFRTAESIARIQENARFAMDFMAPDLRLAGFWGRGSEAAFITIPGAVNVTCGGVNVDAWALNLPAGLQAVDDNYNLPCAPFSAAQPNTDVLVVRHASGQPTLPQAGVVQIQSGRTAAAMFDDGIAPIGLVPAPPLSDTHDLVINAYYVDQQSSLGANIPSLRRQTLVNGGVIQDQELIAGAENLQVQFGVDTDGDGNVERYVDSDAPILDPLNVAFIPDAEVLSVRVWMLIRSTQQETQYNDVGPYIPPDANLGNITPNDPFRRMQVSSTVFLRNTRG